MLKLLLVVLMAAVPVAPQSSGVTARSAAWPALTASMEHMHAGMMSVGSTGNSDVDFVMLMLPHHQAAIDMAKIELLHGKDPQMRRLAQEIVTDQQSEVDLMRLWLKQRESSVPPTPTGSIPKE